MATRTSKKGYVTAHSRKSAQSKLKSAYGKKIAISTTRRGSKVTGGRGYVWSARWKKE